MERRALAEFDQRLRREWAIETGIIEDVYTLDRGITKTLIERGIDAALISHDASNLDSALVARIIQDQYEVLEGLFDFVAGRRPLSTSYVKELHAALLRNIDTHVVQDQFGKMFEKALEKGSYKTDPNSPTGRDGAIHQYSPPEHAASEMDELIRMHLEHESRQVPPEVSAAWLHHRFTQIHPFADGNGRVARAIATLVFIRAGWFPLVIKRDDRARYIECLEKADDGDLRPLIELFVEMQRNLLIAATEIGEDVRPIASAHDAILAARDRLMQQGKVALKSWQVAKETAAKLVLVAAHRLEEVAAELSVEIGALRPGFAFDTSIEDFRDGVRQLALQKAGIAPAYSDFSEVVRLTLRTEAVSQLTLSFQAVGPAFRGLVNVLPYLVVPGGSPMLIDGGSFLINYEEDLASATARFTTWLDRVIVNGLSQWRLTL
jgi:prophage maintenance system killer protein